MNILITYQRKKAQGYRKIAGKIGPKYPFFVYALILYVNLNPATVEKYRKTTTDKMNIIQIARYRGMRFFFSHVYGAFRRLF